MIHIKGVSFNGLKGERLTVTHRDGFGSALAAQSYTKNFFDNGAAVSGAIIYPQALTKEQADRAQSKFQNDYAGADNSGRVMVLDAGVKYEKFSMGPQEAALVDFRNLSVEDCSRIFKIPLHMLSSLDRSTYSNIEQQENDFYAHCLPTWSQKIEQEFNYKLFSRLEREKKRAFVAFDYTFVRMGDSQSTAQLIAATIQNGIMTQNEWRQRLNLPTAEDGNDRYIQQNMAPVGMLAEILEGKNEKPEAPDVENMPDAESDDQPAATPQTDEQ
jgi:HK97 family phage portal protein